MEKTKVIWLDVNMHQWEKDWLIELLTDLNPEFISTNTFNDSRLSSPENCIVVSNHAINYRAYLDLLRSKGCKYGVILLSDENLREAMEYLHDPHCKFVARNYFHPLFHPHPKLFTFALGYKKGFKSPQESHKKFSDREISWCFAGSLHDEERKSATDLFQEHITKPPHKLHFCSGFNAADGLGTDEYKTMLEDSRFALCPRGQVNNDSFRIYEALEAGSIPITLANAPHMKVQPSYWHAIFLGDSELPFVIAEDWKEALEKVKVIEDTGKGDLIQQECSQFWARWKKNWRNEFTRRTQLLHT